MYIEWEQRLCICSCGGQLIRPLRQRLQLASRRVCELLCSGILCVLWCSGDFAQSCFCAGRSVHLQHNPLHSYYFILLACLLLSFGLLVVLIELVSILHLVIFSVSVFTQPGHKGMSEPVLWSAVWGIMGCTHRRV